MNMNDFLKSVLVAGLIAGTTACSTPSRVAGMEGKGKKQTYAASFDRVWEAAIDSAQQGDLQILEANRDQGLIVAKRSFRPETFGENVALWIREVSPAETSVEVKSRQAGPPLFWVRNWENRIQRSIAANMTKFGGGEMKEPAGTEINRQGSSNSESERIPAVREKNIENSIIREPAGAERVRSSQERLEVGGERDRNPGTPDVLTPETEIRKEDLNQEVLP